MAEFLTTKEVADLLRIKERKVYELVSERAIPASRVTGKLLFPRDLLDAWIRRHVDFDDGVGALSPRPPVVSGSHDPLLDWALRESGCSLASLFGGSLDGLARFSAAQSLAAAMHVYEPETEQFNVQHVRERLHGQPVVLMQWCYRMQGLVVAPAGARRIQGIEDLAGAKVIPRQPDAGARVLFDHLLRAAGLGEDAVTLVEPPARSESDVALYVAEGKADAGLAVEAVARQYRLAFVPLFRERFDLLVWRRDFFEAPMQKLLDFCRGPAFRQRADELGGYDLTGFGAIEFNGP